MSVSIGDRHGWNLFKENEILFGNYLEWYKTKITIADSVH
jgi:hypothetical protein